MPSTSDNDYYVRFQRVGFAHLDRNSPTMDAGCPTARFAPSCRPTAFDMEIEMAEVSATPLVRKLGIKPGHRLLFLDAPTDFDRTLGPLLPGCDVLVEVLSEPDQLDVILCFGDRQAALQKTLPALKA